MSKNALILGCSSGFGRATAIELAKKGYNIFGLHLDLGSGRKKAEETHELIKSIGVDSFFINANASDDEIRRQSIEKIKGILDKDNSKIRVFIHSLAFGSLKPFFSEGKNDQINQKSLQMTLDVMANSLLFWVQDLFNAKLFSENSRIIAISSQFATSNMKNYGAVAAAKALLESYIRQIAIELAPYGITAVAIRPGVALTPASSKLMAIDNMVNYSMKANPFGRITNCEDIGKFIGLLIDEENTWLNGASIPIDGGESIIGFAF